MTNQLSIMAEEMTNDEQLNIELSEEVAEGIYSNLAIITHSDAEFVIDFVKMLPGIPKAKVKARIILTPTHAKRLLRALKDNVSKFEAIHGPLEDASGGDFPMNFGGGPFPMA